MVFYSMPVAAGSSVFPTWNVTVNDVGLIHYKTGAPIYDTFFSLDFPDLGVL